MLPTPTKANSSSLKYLNNKGLTLIEIVVGIGLSAILISATTSMILSQQKETKALTQKLELSDLKNQIMQGFVNNDVCTWQFTGKTFSTDRVTTTNPSATTISLDALYAGLDNTSYVFAQRDTALPGSSGLRVSTIQLTKIVATGVTDQYKGTIQISFSPDSMIRAIKPIEISQIITATGSPTASITACGGGSSGVLKFEDLVVKWGADNYRDRYSYAYCDPGYIAVSGGSYYVRTYRCSDEFTGRSHPTSDGRGWQAWMECAQHRTFAICVKLKN